MTSAPHNNISDISLANTVYRVCLPELLRVTLSQALGRKSVVSLIRKTG